MFTNCNTIWKEHLYVSENINIMKKILGLTIFAMFAINSSAKIFVPDGAGRYKQRSDISESLSTFGICKSLGYAKEMFYSVMNPGNKSDIRDVGFKIFTEDIIYVFTNDNVQEITEQDVAKYLKDMDYNFNRTYGTWDREYDLSNGIKSGNLKIAFLSDVMKFNYNTNNIDTMTISKRFGYKLYFKNGTLYKFESSDGLNKCSREWQELYPDKYNLYYAKAQQYWGDNQDKILSDINTQAKSCYSIPSNFMKYMDLFEDESGYINYKIIMTSFSDKISLREFKDITYGEYKYVGERTVKNKTVYTYEYQCWLLNFSKDGHLISTKLKKL
jgi:hypothetical protein